MPETSSETISTPPPDKYYAVILQNDGVFVTEEFDSIDELVARLKQLVDKDVSVACFGGTRFAISKPPLRHLLTPWGNHQLFDMPTDLEPDESGYLGVDPIALQDPPQLKMPQQPRANTGASDDFFDDGNDGTLGVFDSVLPDPDS